VRNKKPLRKLKFLENDKAYFPVFSSVNIQVYISVRCICFTPSQTKLWLHVQNCKVLFCKLSTDQFNYARNRYWFKF